MLCASALLPAYCHGSEPRVGGSIPELAVVVRAPAEHSIRVGDAARVPGPRRYAPKRPPAHDRYGNRAVVRGVVAEGAEVVPPAVTGAGKGHPADGLPPGGEAAERQAAGDRHGCEALHDCAVSHRSEEVVAPAVRLAVAR